MEQNSKVRGRSIGFSPQIVASCYPPTRRVSASRIPIWCFFFLASIFHLRDLCCGNKKIIKSKDAKVISVPFYEGLSIGEMLGYAREIDNGKVLQYLPATPKEVLKLPRAYLCNVIYTVLGEQFAIWVK